MAVIGLVAAPATASAGKGPKIMVVPIGGSVQGEAPSLTSRLTEALRQVIEDSGARATISRTTVDDMLLLHGCSLDNGDCLRGIVKTLDIDELVLGTVARGEGDDRIVVMVVRVSKKGAPKREVIGLQTAELEGQIAELSDGARKLFPPAKPEPKEPEPKEQDPPPIEEPLNPVTPQPPVDDDRHGSSLRNVKIYSWVLAGVGLAVAGTGVAFWGAGNSLQSDVDATDPLTLQTVEELDELRDLEDRADTRFKIGNGLVIAGGAMTAAGITLIILQSRGMAGADKGVAITPSVVPGGAGLTFTVTR